MWYRHDLRGRNRRVGSKQIKNLQEVLVGHRGPGVLGISEIMMTEVDNYGVSATVQNKHEISNNTSSISHLEE